jgi:hypothetical protein
MVARGIRFRLAAKFVSAPLLCRGKIASLRLLSLLFGAVRAIVASGRARRSMCRFAIRKLRKDLLESRELFCWTTHHYVFQDLAEVGVTVITSEAFCAGAEGGDEHGLVGVRRRLPVGLRVVGDHHAKGVCRWIGEQRA